MIVASIDCDRTWGCAPLSDQPSWRTLGPFAGSIPRAPLLDPPGGSGQAIGLLLRAAQSRLRRVLVVGRVVAPGLVRPTGHVVRMPVGEILGCEECRLDCRSRPVRGRDHDGCEKKREREKRA